MHLSLRFLIPLLLALGAFAYAAVPLVDTLMLRWSVRDLDTRASFIAASVQEPLAALIAEGSPTEILAFFNRLLVDERLYAIGLCLPGQSAPVATRTFPDRIRCETLADYDDNAQRVIHTNHGALHLSARPVEVGPGNNSQLVLVHDMSFIERRSEETKRYLFYFFVALGAIVALITVAIAQLSWRGWVQGLRALLHGEGILRPSMGSRAPELRPIERDVRELIRDLERRYRPLDDSGRLWTQETLRATLKSELRGNDVIAVSNREPFIHVRASDGIHVQRPASGLVTAVEPVMRACSGIWIAHGSGSADRDTVDRNDRIGVPPGRPGLSAASRLAHGRGRGRATTTASRTRACGRSATSRTRGRRFAPATSSTTARSTRALRRRWWRKRRRRTPSSSCRTITSRCCRDDPQALARRHDHHVLAYPVAQSGGVRDLPVAQRVLEGMLGSSILGFHTQFHCNNFLDTVDRLLEARVDRESFTVSRQGRLTQVNRYPISIEWPPAALAALPGVDECRRTVRERLGLPRKHRLGVGIDRLDYTKGVLERFQAVARLMELEPQWVGKFSFVQIAAPTRGTIGDYRDYAARVKSLAAEINDKYRDAKFPPIILLAEHHQPDSVYEHHRAADVCFVSSLHDGMNLVAKEFVAARDDEHGVLVLSRFAGASRELPEALIVNPYDYDECAAALHLALTMPADEQRDRMRLMRGIVREFNVYRWAGRMLLDAAVMRQRSRYGATDVAVGRI